MSAEVNAGGRDWAERLERADAMFKAGNVTGAASLAHAVEVEVEMQRKRAAVGSAEGHECMRMLKRARAALERFEFAAAIDDEEDEEDD
jgi:hypothetical protein